MLYIISLNNHTWSVVSNHDIHLTLHNIMCLKSKWNIKHWKRNNMGRWVGSVTNQTHWSSIKQNWKLNNDGWWWQWLMVTVGDDDGGQWWRSMMIVVITTVVDYDGGRWWRVMMTEDDDDGWRWWGLAIMRVGDDKGGQWWRWTMMVGDDDGGRWLAMMTFGGDDGGRWWLGLGRVPRVVGYPTVASGTRTQFWVRVPERLHCWKVWVAIKNING